MSQRPSVGRIVLVTVHPTTNNGAEVAPAIITRVWTDDMVNVAIFLDGANGTKARTSIPLHADRETLDAAAAQRVTDQQPHTADTTYTAAYWPPRI